jgi:hypothetical protein
MLSKTYMIKINAPRRISPAQSRKQIACQYQHSALINLDNNKQRGAQIAEKNPAALICSILPHSVGAGD